MRGGFINIWIGWEKKKEILKSIWYGQVGKKVMRIAHFNFNDQCKYIYFFILSPCPKLPCPLTPHKIFLISTYILQRFKKKNTSITQPKIPVVVDMPYSFLCLLKTYKQCTLFKKLSISRYMHMYNHCWDAFKISDSEFDFSWKDWYMGLKCVCIN